MSQHSSDFYIVEHRSRGVLMGFYWGYRAKGPQTELVRFSWSKRRTEGVHYATREQADAALAKCAKIGIKNCYLVKFPKGEIIEPGRQRAQAN